MSWTTARCEPPSARKPATPPRRPPPQSRSGDGCAAADAAPASRGGAGNWLSAADEANRAAMPDPAMWDDAEHDPRGVAEAELERGLKKALKRQRDTEVRLQLEMQKAIEVSGAASRLLQERELLTGQVEDIRGRLLEAKLQNGKLKNELHSRNEQAGACVFAVPERYLHHNLISGEASERLLVSCVVAAAAVGECCGRYFARSTFAQASTLISQGILQQNDFARSRWTPRPWVVPTAAGA